MGGGGEGPYNVGPYNVVAETLRQCCFNVGPALDQRIVFSAPGDRSTGG